MSLTAIANQGAKVSDPARPRIAFSNVTLDLGGKIILENISLDVDPGEFLCIVGPSGCGKRPRCAFGRLISTTRGVTFNGMPSARRRDIAIVFQDYGKALLPWRTAAGNVSLALEASGVASSGAAPALTSC